MIRVKDIANMVGVSPTTVSNVIHGNTKRVSQETAQKISSILDEVGIFLIWCPAFVTEYFSYYWIGNRF